MSLLPIMLDHHLFCSSIPHLSFCVCVFFYRSSSKSGEEKKIKHTTGLSHSLFGSETLEDEDDLFTGEGTKVYGWMDGWDGWMDGQMDGWMD